MDFYLGVDSGGTKTKTVIVDADGVLRASSTKGATDIFNTGVDEAKRILNASINEVLQVTGIQRRELTCSCFGMSTYGDIPARMPAIEEIVKSSINRDYTIINDVRAALEGAHPLRPGVVLLVGTGAMIMGKDSDDNCFRIDGWGENVGDLGSGYYIGRRGLQEAFKAYDGRNPEAGALLEAARKNMCEGGDLREIIQRCKGNNSRSYIASFSRYVSTLADKGDKPGLMIIERAADEVYLSLETIAKRIEDPRINVSYAGGVFQSEIFSRLLNEKVNRSNRYRWSDPVTDPAFGAVIMAIKKGQKAGYIKSVEQLVQKNRRMTK